MDGGSYIIPSVYDRPCMDGGSHIIQNGNIWGFWTWQQVHGAISQYSVYFKVPKRWPDLHDGVYLTGFKVGGETKVFFGNGNFFGGYYGFTLQEM